MVYEPPQNPRPARACSGVAENGRVTASPTSWAALGPALAILIVNVSDFPTISGAGSGFTEVERLDRQAVWRVGSPGHRSCVSSPKPSPSASCSMSAFTSSSRLVRWKVGGIALPPRYGWK